MSHKFPYKWYLKDEYPEKNGLKVFSCFACGGGSTMGYKLAGYEVLGANEIDPKMAECYKVNHNPKYLYVEPIQEFKLREDLPEELYHLDILDGSPPCSSFSMAGNREKDWGKEKKFREGQADQVLDTLFFDFIDLAERLQPKVVIAENVKGLLLGDAKKYVWEIYQAFEKAGYHVHKWLLDASKMGVPQRRERVFFVAIRKDLVSKIEGLGIDLFNPMPHLDMEFKENGILFKKISDNEDVSIKDNTKISEYWDKVKHGQSFSTAHPTGSFFNDNKSHPEKVLPTITADPGHGSWHFDIKRLLNKNELLLAGTFPEDYLFHDVKPQYLIGMSVPPVMTAQIATRIKEQWFNRMCL
jgi:DNA (cytosine-5)-methyltransferase 1